MATYRETCYDIYSILRSNFDDTEITLNHIFFWVRIYGDRLRVQHDEKIDSGLTTLIFSSIPVLIDPVTGRKYIVIPASIYDLDGDSGIEYLSYNYQVDMNAFTYVTFSRTEPGFAQRLYWTEEEKPSPENPYFYRAGNNIYLLGLECIDVRFLEAGLKTSVPATCSLDDEFVFPPELLPILQRQILDLGRFVLQIPADRTNDSDYSLQNQQIPKTKIISTASITDPTQQVQTQQQEA